MAASESLAEVVPDGPPNAGPQIGDAEPHGYGNGHVNGSPISISCCTRSRLCGWEISLSACPATKPGFPAR
jgi:hypothetical protein